MAVVIDNSVGGVAANSYADVNYADAFALTSASGAAWLALATGGATPATKEALLVRAARIVDTLGFVGIKATAAQTMMWPRYGVDEPSGSIYDPTTVPVCIRDAQAMIACYLATFVSAGVVTDDPFGVDPFVGLSRISVGTIDIQMDAPRTSSTHPTAGGDFLSRFVVPMLRARLVLGPAGSIRLVR